MNAKSPGATRRRVLAGGIGLAGIGALAYFTLSGIFRPRYLRTPYDDLLARLADRENAAVLGKARLKQLHQANGRFSAAEVSADLRNLFARQNLQQIVESDLNSPHGLVEVEGWVLPGSLTALCALAALPWPPPAKSLA